MLHSSVGITGNENRQCVFLRENHRMFRGEGQACIVQSSSTSPHPAIVFEEAELSLPLWKPWVLFKAGLSIHDPEILGFGQISLRELG